MILDPLPLVFLIVLLILAAVFDPTDTIVMLVFIATLSCFLAVYCFLMWLQYSIILKPLYAATDNETETVTLTVNRVSAEVFGTFATRHFAALILHTDMGKLTYPFPTKRKYSFKNVKSMKEKLSGTVSLTYYRNSKIVHDLSID